MCPSNMHVAKPRTQGKEGIVGWDYGDTAENGNKDSICSLPAAQLGKPDPFIQEKVPLSLSRPPTIYFLIDDWIALHRCSIISLTISCLWIFNVFLIFPIINKATWPILDPCAQVTFELDFGNLSQKMFSYLLALPHLRSDWRETERVLGGRKEIPPPFYHCHLLPEDFPDHSNLHRVHPFLLCIVSVPSTHFPSCSLHVSIRI